MPIDASIISGLKPVQMESPMNGLAKLLEVQGAQQNMQMGRMKMDEYQQGLTRASGLRSLSLPASFFCATPHFRVAHTRP